MNIGNQQRVIVVEPLAEGHNPAAEVPAEPEAPTRQFTPEDWRTLGVEINSPSSSD